MKMGKAVVDGKNYEFGFLDIDTSMEYLTKLMRLLGEPLAKFLLGALGEGSLKDLLDKDMDALKGDGLSEAISNLSSRLREDEVKDILRTLGGKGILCEGKKIAFDAHYMGKPGHLMRVALANARFQFGDFLGGSPGQDE